RDPLRRWEAVDARGDERLQRVRDALGARVLGEHAHGLLDEERIPLRLREHRCVVDRQLQLLGERGDELLALVRLQRLELERRRADAAAAPGRADVEQLRPREAEDEERRLAHPGGEVLDQLEQRLLAPVDVLEDEHERLRGGELLGPRARGPGDLLLRALALDGLEDADGEAEQVGDGVVFAVGAQLLLRLVERVVVGDAGRGLHHLGERPVRDALAVRERAAEEDGRALDAGYELAREAALADAGIAVDRDERGAARADGALVRVLEQLELALAADERRREPAHGRAGVDDADGAVGDDRLAEAAQLERADLFELDAVAEEAGGGGADQELVRSGGDLQAGGDVHRLAGGEGLV